MYVYMYKCVYTYLHMYIHIHIHTHNLSIRPTEDARTTFDIIPVLALVYCPIRPLVAPGKKNLKSQSLVHLLRKVTQKHSL